jgi:hypothetical protein
MNYYAGIGARDTPENILNIMHHIGAYLADQGWILRSGAANGADASFEEGALRQGGKTEIYLPWKTFNHHGSDLNSKAYPFNNKEKAFTAKFHPAWKKCSPSVRLLHQRNTRIMVGMEALHGEMVVASRFVVCWTPYGELRGGTAQALRIAVALDIPIINLGAAKTPEELEALVLKVDELQNQMKVVKHV